MNARQEPGVAGVGTLGALPPLEDGLSPELQLKHELLRSIVRGMESAALAYSGGVDSSLVLDVAREVLGDKFLAVVAASETYPEEEIDGALRTAKQLGVAVHVIHTEELRNSSFASNPPNRCYYCKSELFSKIRLIAAEHGLAFVLDGANADDAGDFRPGLAAGKELGVRSPLKEAGLSKGEIREISRHRGLPTWNKPSFACLSSRFPYNSPITPEKLSQVGSAERLLRGMGFKQFRVRHHDNLARIELEPADIPTMLERRADLVAQLKKLGYTYVTLDLQGYRTGSMNEVLEGS